MFTELKLLLCDVNEDVEACVLLESNPLLDVLDDEIDGAPDELDWDDDEAVPGCELLDKTPLVDKLEVVTTELSMLL